MSASRIALVCALFICMFATRARAQFPRYRYGHSNTANTISKYLKMRASGEGNRKPYQRYAVGFSYLPLSGTMSYHTFDKGHELIDSSYAQDINGYGIGVAYSTFFPVAKLTDRSILAIHLGVNVNYNQYKGDSINIRKEMLRTQFKAEYDGGGIGFLVGVPVGLDFISGGEAILDKSIKSTFTLGAGIFASGSITGIGKFGAAKAMLPFYMKAELAMHMGINWKFRVMYFSKSLTNFESSYDHTLDNYPQNTSIKTETIFSGNDRLMLSILVQPFSWDWEESVWWKH